MSVGWTADQSEDLSTDECLRLLRSVTVGRVALTQRALPVVVPVNFAMDGHSVLIRTAPESLLTAAHDRDVVVAFQVDELDPVTLVGWSVLITGTMREITDASAQVRADQLRLVPASAGERNHYVRITPGLVSGRRMTERGMVGGRLVPLAVLQSGKE